MKKGLQIDDKSGNRHQHLPQRREERKAYARQESVLPVPGFALRRDAFAPLRLCISLYVLFSEYMKIDCGLWNLWAKGRAVGNALRFPRQASRFAVGELSTNPQTFGFDAAARCIPGLTSPYRSTERRADFSLITRTVAGACKPAFCKEGCDERDDS
jgi:hypothetical protein